MLDIKFIRENSELIEKTCKQKNIRFDIQKLLDVDSQIRPLQSELENCLAKRNAVSKEIPKLNETQREEAKKEVSILKTSIEEIEGKLTQLKLDFESMMLLVPQPARSDVPVGKDDSENVEVKKWGKIPEFSFPIKDHAELGEKLGILDFERGVKLAGSRSYVLKGEGAELEQAVLRLCYDKLVKKSYQAMTIPVLVKEDAMTGTGYFPTGRDQAYLAERDKMALVGTAEVSLTSFYGGEILKDEQLPIRMMAQSSCFRREAGSYGKDTKGLYRVHQFQKIEQVILGHADVAESEALHNELLNNAEELLQDLGLAYRVVYVCTGDLGQGQVRKHDIETWMPSRKNYGETHSCSTFHDFQARRLKLRYKDKNGQTQFCYTLNNTAVASPRILIPLLECYQNADGSITIPEVLRKYMGGKEKISLKMQK